MSKKKTKPDKNGFGFGNMNKQSSIYDNYIGKIVSASYNNNNIIGILRDINLNENRAYFLPSLIIKSDGSLYIQDELPVQVLLPLGVVYPLKETLEEYVETYNLKLKQKPANHHS